MQKMKRGETRVEFANRLFMTRSRGIYSTMKQRAAKAAMPCNLTMDIVRQKVKEAMGRPCRYCLEPITVKSFSGDHLVSSSAGGTFDADNIQIIDQRCNELKGKLSHDDFMLLLDGTRTMTTEGRRDVFMRIRAGGRAFNQMFWKFGKKKQGEPAGKSAPEIPQQTANVTYQDNLF